MADRTPLHPQALTLGDVQPGVEFIVFHRAFGVSCRGTFLAAPHTAVRGPLPGCRETRYPAVTTSAETYPLRLDDAGILPRSSGKWDRFRFTIPAALEHTLPPAEPALLGEWREFVGFPGATEGDQEA